MTRTSGPTMTETLGGAGLIWPSVMLRAVASAAVTRGAKSIVVVTVILKFYIIFY